MNTPARLRAVVTPAFALLVALAAGPVGAQTLLHELASPHEEADGYFGESVAGVGDVDGDGRGDLLIGAYGEAVDTLEYAGRAYLYSGASGILLHELVSPNEERYGHFGYSVSGVKDLDGDGVADLLVGAYRETLGDGPEVAGRAYVFSGSTRALLRELVSPIAEDGGYFGTSVSGVPDVDGDGRDDLLVGSWESPGASPENAGRVHLFSGATGAFLHTLASPNEKPVGLFGSSVSGVPDSDGDGRGDLLVGASGEDPGSSPRYAGRAYLFSGATGALLHTLASSNEQRDGRFGHSVSGVEDVDGDGRGDLLVGAYQEANDTGRAYLFSGASGTLVHTLYGIHGCYFGTSVSGLEDIDGDGRGDLLVGAYGAGGPYLAGRADVFSGASGEVLFSLASPNPEEYGYFGGAVSGVEDVNGDGRDDVLVGAPGEDGGGNPYDIGRAYVFSEIPPTPPLALTLTPTDPPRPVVVPQGGRALFDATFDLAPGGPSEFEVWTLAVRPDGVVIGPLIGPLTVLVTPGTSVTLPFEQGVGRSSLVGEYAYAMYAGTYPGAYPDGVLALDTELATVVPVAASTTVGADEEWRAYDATGAPLGAGAVLDLRTLADVPPSGPTGAFALRGPSPNPAAERASVALTLAEPSGVRVSLYDVLGREVAAADAGMLAAGAHRIALDVSALPSGVYVWRLVAGTRVETGRLTVAR